jgi:hypothetical protein
MKAIRVFEFGPPSALKLMDVPSPKPGPGEILVRVKAVGVNPVDTYIRDGAYRKTVSPPYTPGSDAAGLVEGVGAEVTSFYAELTVSRVNQVHRLPERLSFPQGAAINVPYATARVILFPNQKPSRELLVDVTPQIIVAPSALQDDPDAPARGLGKDVAEARTIESDPAPAHRTRGEQRPRFVQRVVGGE